MNSRFLPIRDPHSRLINKAGPLDGSADEGACCRLSLIPEPHMREESMSFRSGAPRVGVGTTPYAFLLCQGSLLPSYLPFSHNFFLPFTFPPAPDRMTGMTDSDRCYSKLGHWHHKYFVVHGVLMLIISAGCWGHAIPNLQCSLLSSAVMSSPLIPYTLTPLKSSLFIYCRQSYPWECGDNSPGNQTVPLR